MSMATKHERMVVANLVIEAISQFGRQFFLHKGRVSKFELDSRGRLWFIDGYTQRRIYVAYEGKWRGFTEGGTLRDLIKNLGGFIRSGDPIRRRFGPWPEWICDGDLWGYGESMGALRARLEAIIPQSAWAKKAEAEK